MSPDPADKPRRKTPYRDWEHDQPHRERQEGQPSKPDRDESPDRGADRPSRPDQDHDRPSDRSRVREPG